MHKHQYHIFGFIKKHYSHYDMLNKFHDLQKSLCTLYSDYVITEM